MRNNKGELKFQLKQMENELETIKIENKSLQQDNHRLNHTLFDQYKYMQLIAIYGIPKLGYLHVVL